MRDLELQTANVQDPVVRDNLDRVQQFVDENVLMRFRGKHVEIERSADGTYTYNHNLGYRPRDVLQTSVRTQGTATIAWNYDSFTTSSVSFTVAGLAANETLTVRAFIGVYLED